MTSASQLNPPPEAIVVPPRPRPMQSLLASAQRITATKVNRKPIIGDAEWQNDAWAMFNLVGEEHFLATTLASRLSQARLYVGEMGDDPTQEPTAVTEGPVSDAFEAFGEGSSRSQSQILARLGIGLFMTGEGWLVGIPRDLLPEDEDASSPTGSRGDTATFAPIPSSPFPPPPEDEEISGGDTYLNDMEWRVLSVSEVTTTRGDEITLRLGPGQGDDLTCKPEDVYLIRVWRPHPQYWWEADAPTRASLPVLHELVGLTMHISAQVDSRLAGAGLLLVPQSAARAFRIATGANADDAEVDPFSESLMEAMLTPIKDRASAAAVVPLVATVPDEAADKFEFISFATPLDGEARNLRDEAIRRLALGQDAPPELLLGTAGMNHWGSWLIREDVVSTHLEPPLALICDALTTQYLHPVLLEQGMSEEEVRRYVVWYDVGHLITRPNRFDDAKALYEQGVLSASTLRDAGGFTDEDAPTEKDVDPAVDMVLSLISKDTGLITSPGLGVLLEQVTALINGEPIPDLPTPEPPAPPEDEEPALDEDGNPIEEPTTPEGEEEQAPGVPPNPTDAAPAPAGPPSMVPNPLGGPTP